MNKRDFKELFRFEENDRDKKMLKKDWKKLEKMHKKELEFKHIIGKLNNDDLFKILTRIYFFYRLLPDLKWSTFELSFRHQCQKSPRQPPRRAYWWFQWKHYANLVPQLSHIQDVKRAALTLWSQREHPFTPGASVDFWETFVVSLLDAHLWSETFWATLFTTLISIAPFGHSK